MAPHEFEPQSLGQRMNDKRRVGGEAGPKARYPDPKTDAECGATERGACDLGRTPENLKRRDD